MLRNTNQPWWRKLLLEPAPAYIQTAAMSRRCPECSAAYEPRDRYCPRCHTATPEWRYG